jgi:hypothetical protein
MGPMQKIAMYQRLFGKGHQAAIRPTWRDEGSLTIPVSIRIKFIERGYIRSWRMGVRAGGRDLG